MQSAGDVDPMLEELLVRCASKYNGVEPFMGAIFQFFAHKTDLFHEMVRKEDPMGFPPGVAEQIVLRQFKKWQQYYKWKTGNAVPDGIEQRAIRRPAVGSGAPSSTSEGTVGSSSSSSAAKKSEKKQAAPPSAAQAAAAAAASSSSSSGANASISAQPAHINEKQKQSAAYHSTWNGAVNWHDGYRWSQSLNEVTLEIDCRRPCPSGKTVDAIGKDGEKVPDVQVPARDEKDVVRAKELKVKYDNRHLKVTRTHPSGETWTVVDAPFHERVNVEESLWAVEQGGVVGSTEGGKPNDDVGKRLVFHLHKLRGLWWSQLLRSYDFRPYSAGGVDEKKESGDQDAEKPATDALGPEEEARRRGDWVDTSQVESTKRVEDYDGSTQGSIRKIMFDESQKRQGLPTSDQIQTFEMMKGAWNAEGSPLRGTPCDPSALNLTGQMHPGGSTS